MYKTYHINQNESAELQMQEIIADFGTPNFVSPGYAGAYLGVSRQAIEQAIRKGALKAAKIYDGKKHTATMIDAYSLDKYKELRTLNGGRIPYRARAV